MSFHVKLRRERLASFHLNQEMNVRGGPGGIRNRLDRAKVVFPGRTGLETAEPLEVHVETAGRFSASFLEISGRAIDLPDFNDRIPDGLPVQSKQPPTEM